MLLILISDINIKYKYITDAIQTLDWHIIIVFFESFFFVYYDLSFNSNITLPSELPTPQRGSRLDTIGAARPRRLSRMFTILNFPRRNVEFKA